MFEELYDSDKCTPNMHLHGHILDCILDYGPISSFWAFAFERYNGVLESFVKNWMSPERQMMHKFLSYQEIIGAKDLHSLDKNFSGLFEFCTQSHSVGAFQHHLEDGVTSALYSKNATCSVYDVNATLQPFQVINNSKVFEKYFSDCNTSYLREIYSKLYPYTSGYTISFVQRKHTVINSVCLVNSICL